MTDMTDSLHRKETERHQKAIRRKRMEKRLDGEEKAKGIQNNVESIPKSMEGEINWKFEGRYY